MPHDKWNHGQCPAEERAAFIRDNAVALVEMLEGKVQRRELTRLNKRSRSLRLQLDREREMAKE